MKTIAITFLALALPAALSAQQKTLLQSRLPEDTTSQAAPQKEAAEIQVIKPSAPKPAARPAPAAKPAPAPAPAAKPAPAPRPVKKTAPSAVSRKAGPGEPAVQPRQDPAASFMPSELVSAASLSPVAMRSGGFVVGKKHTIMRGDTLWDLSGKYYKNPFMWGRIYNANFNTVADPDRIYPRRELIIPDINEVVIPFRPASAYAREGGEGEAAYYGAAARAEAARRAALPEPGEILRDFDESFLSEEMPEHQKEWSGGVRVVPDDWREDGVVAAKLKNDDEFQEEGLSIAGENLEISMRDPGAVRPGDYLAVYLKGAEAYDKAGRRLGREVQPAGLAEVFSVEGGTVKARVIDSVTAIRAGYVVKKK